MSQAAVPAGASGASRPLPPLRGSFALVLRSLPVDRRMSVNDKDYMFEAMLVMIITCEPVARGSPALGSFASSALTACR